MVIYSKNGRDFWEDMIYMKIIWPFIGMNNSIFYMKRSYSKSILEIWFRLLFNIGSRRAVCSDNIRFTSLHIPTFVHLNLAGWWWLSETWNIFTPEIRCLTDNQRFGQNRCAEIHFFQTISASLRLYSCLFTLIRLQCWGDDEYKGNLDLNFLVSSFDLGAPQIGQADAEKKCSS